MAIEDDIAALEAAIRRGAKHVSYDGQTVTMDIPEMRATLRDLKRQAGQITSVGQPVYPTFDKGV